MKDEFNQDKRELKQLADHAKMTIFQIGSIEVYYNFEKCFDLCKMRHDIRKINKDSPTFYILQDIDHKISQFCEHKKLMGDIDRFFYVNTKQYLFLDIKDLFCGIFLRFEGLLSILNYSKFPFMNAIDTFKLDDEIKEDLKKLTTLRNKLFHVAGYPIPKYQNKTDSRLNDLLEQGIKEIMFNKDPNYPLILEQDRNNLTKWVRLIEILIESIIAIKF